MEQLSLLDMTTPLLSDEFSEREPLIWIKELRFITEASPEAEEKCKIYLRRGLNIVWAKPLTEEIAQDKHASVAGHAAGKTTFCRMLRFALGEPRLANEVVTNSIRAKFPRGCVCAEIIIEGEQWSVCRPVGAGYHPKCLQGGGIDQLLNAEGTSYDEFKERLDKLADSTLAAPKLPNDIELSFQHILPWLSRDQEAGYRDLTEWRDKSSNAESPFQRQDDRYFCMRSLLSLITGEEIDLIKQRDEKNREVESLRVSSNTLKPQKKLEQNRIVSEAGDTIDVELLGLSLDEIKKSLEATRDQIVVADEETPMLKQAEDEYRKIFQKLGIAERELSMLQDVCADNDKRYRMLAAKDAKDDHRYQAIKQEARRHPERMYCCQPIEVARAEGCPLCQEEMTIDFSSERELRKEENQADRLRQNYELSKANVERQQSIVAEIRQDEQKASAHYNDLRKKHQEQINLNRGKYSLCERLIRDLTAFKDLSRTLDDQETKMDHLATEIEMLADQIGAYRDQARQQLGVFSASYDRMLREVLGTAVSGDVKLHGTSFRVKAEYKGELTSAAIESLKTIIFDLTAIVFALNDNAQHPCFLIHDGPRAADLDAWLYKKIFVLMYNLEQKSNASFQYIITTTEPPPSDLQEKPWLVHELDASAPEGRLLRVNL
jgi:hypothetical protein